MRHIWVSRVGMVMLVGGLCLVGSGLRITPATAAPPVKENALAGVTQNWDKNLPSASRFTVLPSFNNEAVRDNNTGLVWEQAPDSTTRMWVDALASCLIKNVGGTRGWRLPSVVELASLIDPALPAPFVPTSDFTGVQIDTGYWSATAYAGNPTDAWSVGFDVAPAFFINRASHVHVWCVRGAMNVDTY